MRLDPQNPPRASFKVNALRIVVNRIINTFPMLITTVGIVPNVKYGTEVKVELKYLLMNVKTVRSTTVIG